MTASERLLPKSKALAKIRICDLSGMLAGAGATRFLAAFGAQVIRVEDPRREGRWDVLRGGPPYLDDRRGINLGGAFNNHNVEKLGITLNLRTERGRAIFLRLVGISDVVTENFSAGVMDRLGLGYERLREVNDRVIYVSNSGFGKNGPYASFKTFGPIVQALCGLTFTSGLPGLEPAGWGYSYMDHMGGNFMALAVLAGLVHRNRSGRGQQIDMSCTEAGLGLAGPGLLDFTVNSRSVRAPGSVDSNSEEFPAMVPHGIYPASEPDSWVAIACRDDRDWEKLAAIIREDWTSDPRLIRLEGRVWNRSEVDRRISEWTSLHEAKALEELVRAVGVPVAKVASPAERIEHDTISERWGLWPVARHTEMGHARVDGIPVHLSETDWVIARGAPCLGEHNSYIYGELLGLSDREIDSMTSSGVI